MTDSRQQRRVRARGKTPIRISTLCGCRPGVTWCKRCFSPPGFYASGTTVDPAIAALAVGVTAEMLSEVSHG